MGHVAYSGDPPSDLRRRGHVFASGARSTAGARGSPRPGLPRPTPPRGGDIEVGPATGPSASGSEAFPAGVDVAVLGTPMLLLLTSVAVADPVAAVTADGQTVVLQEDGTWAFVPPEVAGEAPAPVDEPVGAWRVDLGRGAATGRATGGATTPNLDGAGYMAITCDGRVPATLFVFSDHPLHEVSQADYASFGAQAAFAVPYRRGKKKLVGPALTRGTIEAMAVPAWVLLKVLVREPRDELVAEHLRPDREGWPPAVRFSLDGFREAWAQVADACQGRFPAEETGQDS
jgi:hypothetical protein